MEKKNMFLMSHEELFADGPKQIAIITDGLTANECKNALNLCMRLEKEGKVNKLGYRNLKPKYSSKPFSLGFTVHECLQRYPIGMRDGLSEEDILNKCNMVEFMRLLSVEEIWYFDIGENWLPYDGRLMERLKTLGKPVRFLCRVQDNTTWDFYRSLEWKFNGETGEMEEEYRIVGEEEPYVPTEEELARMKENEGKPHKSFRKGTLSDKEHDLLQRAYGVNVKAGARATVSSVRLEEENYEKFQKLVYETSDIILGILMTESCTDEEIRNFDAKLDFIEAELDEAG